MRDVFNVKQAEEAQEEYCRKNQIPRFAPKDGYCHACNEQIYRGPRGIDVATAGSRLITGCPICGASFLE